MNRQKPCSDCPAKDFLQNINSCSAVIKDPAHGKYFSVTISPIIDNKNNRKYFVCIARDITSTKQLEEKLLQSQKMEAIGTLAGGIAHDFNNILAAIQGYTEFIQKEVPEKSTIGTYAAEILTAGNRAADLVRQILTFSRQGDSEKQVLQPHLIVQEALKMLQATLPATLHMEEDIDPDCGNIVADPTIIHQIVINLCTNSLHAMAGQKGTLHVEVQRREVSAAQTGARENVAPGSFVALTVGDNGCGMDQETVDRIFEPYFTTREMGRGTGLGLAIIHGAVEVYNGFIEVESRLGKGTVVSLYFPLTKKPVTRKIAFKQKNRKEIPAGDVRILVVDDEPFLVKINEKRLQSQGYQVTAVIDSKEALEKFRNQPESFDLLITDQTMPGLTGEELAKAVLKINPALPAIMCTGHSDVVSKDKALSMGIKKYVLKPLHGDELLEAVEEVLG